MSFFDVLDLFDQDGRERRRGDAPPRRGLRGLLNRVLGDDERDDDHRAHRRSRDDDDDRYDDRGRSHDDDHDAARGRRRDDDGLFGSWD